jgi:hypothetical protein
MVTNPSQQIDRETVKVVDLDEPTAPIQRMGSVMIGLPLRLVRGLIDVAAGAAVPMTDAASV